MLKFITGNKNKFREIQKMLAPIKVKQVKIDLDEIQEVDPKKIIEHKIRQAFRFHEGEFIVEDDAMYLSCLDYKLPGTFIKWFDVTIGNQGMLELAKVMKNDKATAESLIAYAKSPKDITFFSGKITGQMVKPKVQNDFGYDPIFKPNGSSKTFAELKLLGDFSLSPRAKSAAKLKKYLLKHAE